MKTETTLEIKNADVFRFQWKYDPADTQRDRYWCFDGQLVAVLRNGSIVLADTYWRFGEIDNHTKTFTPEEAQEKGTLTYVCNLIDLEPAQPHETRYYDKADLFDLSYQHRCYAKLMKRKGAKKNRDAMYKALAQDRKEAEEQLRAAVHKLEWIARTTQIVQDAADVENVYP